jgi:hypothetical protein
MGTQLIKFRHNDKVGLFHYTIFEGDFVALSEKNTSKINYIKARGALDVTFDMDSTIYDVMAVDVIEDLDYVKKVYDYMQKTENSYFNQGPKGLVVLKFHK